MVFASSIRRRACADRRGRAQTEFTLGAEWRSYESYRTIMVDRLTDLVGLEESGRDYAAEPPQNGLMLEF